MRLTAKEFFYVLPGSEGSCSAFTRGLRLVSQVFFVPSSAQGTSEDYLSLEIYDDVRLSDAKKIGMAMLLIHSRMRKEFLFGDAPVL